MIKTNAWETMIPMRLFLLGNKNFCKKFKISCHIPITDRLILNEEGLKKNHQFQLAFV